MHGLETIRAINADPAAYHAANEAAAAEHARTQPTRDEALAQQKAHGDRVRARQAANGPYVNPQGPETPPAARTPFGDFWIKLNAERGADVAFGDARKLFDEQRGVVPFFSFI